MDEPDPLSPWQREVLESLVRSDAERITLNVPHRQGRAALYALAEGHTPESPGGTPKTATE